MNALAARGILSVNILIKTFLTKDYAPFMRAHFSGNYPKDLPKMDDKCLHFTRIVRGKLTHPLRNEGEGESQK